MLVLGGTHPYEPATTLVTLRYDGKHRRDIGESLYNSSCKYECLYIGNAWQRIHKVLPYRDSMGSEEV